MYDGIGGVVGETEVVGESEVLNEWEVVDIVEVANAEDRKYEIVEAAPTGWRRIYVGDPG